MLMSRDCVERGLVPGEPHLQLCLFEEHYEAAVRSPLVEWLASLPAEYERLKARAAAQGLSCD